MRLSLVNFILTPKLHLILVPLFFPIGSCSSSEVDLVSMVWKVGSGHHHSGAQLVGRAVHLLWVQDALQEWSIIAHLQVYLSPL